MTATTQDVDRAEGLARLARAVRLLHADGWTWTGCVQWFDPPREHRYVRGELQLLVQLDAESLRLRVGRASGGRTLLDLHADHEVLDGAALVDLIAGLA